MDAISNISRLIEIIRRRNAEKKPVTYSAPPSKGRPNQRSIAVLKQTFIERCLQKENVLSQDEKSRLFFETLLTWKFGDQIKDDGNFNRLLEELDALLKSDREVYDEFHRILGRL